MITPGDITPGRDTNQELYVVVLSNTIHLAAATGQVIICPFIPGEIPSSTMAMIVTVLQPKGLSYRSSSSGFLSRPSTNPSAISAASRSLTRPRPPSPRSFPDPQRTIPDRNLPPIR